MTSAFIELTRQVELDHRNQSSLQELVKLLENSEKRLTASFEASRGACGATGHKQVTGGAEDFKLNCIGELVPVVS